MTTTTKAPKAFLSGFCNPSFAAEDPSHGRCPLEYKGNPCRCTCHVQPEVHPIENGLEVAGDPGDLQPAAEPITVPGLIYGMDDETYHADPVPGGSLSSSLARAMTNDVPIKAVFRQRNRKPTKSMNLGKAAHSYALGTGPDLIVWVHDGRTKEGKAERAAVADLLATEAAVSVTADEAAQILGMAGALRAHPEIAALLEASEHEVSGFAEVEGIWVRARYDILTPDLSYDYKTCQDASRRGFSKAMASYGYHQQAELYDRVLTALDHPAGKSPMRFICQETEAPYLVQIHTPDALAMEVARELNDRAIRIFREAMATGVWPGYAELEAEPTGLPNFYYYDKEDALPEHWRATSLDGEIR